MPKYIYRKICKGDKFGHLTVIDDTPVKRKYSDGYDRKFYKCVCDCGNVCEVNMNKLNNGHTTTCGCKTGGEPFKKDHPQYGRAADIWDRCFNKNNIHYRRYGGRGIRCDLGDTIWGICKALEKVPGYKPGLTIDRIDNDGNYTLYHPIHGRKIWYDEKGRPCLGNLRWVTHKENTRNRNTSVTLKSLEEFPRRRMSAKRAMEVNGFSFNDFEEIEVCRNKDNKKMYIYKLIK